MKRRATVIAAMLVAAAFQGGSALVAQHHGQHDRASQPAPAAGAGMEGSHSIF